MMTEFIYILFPYIFSLYVAVYYYFNFSNYYRKKIGKYKWDCFTRIISTINALQCTYMALNAINDNKVDIWALTSKKTSFETYSFLSFALYLFVDGIMQLPDLITHFSSGLVLSILHHFIGGYGIYLIGIRNVGLFLGIYFALTEISTPLLNLSWWLYRKNIVNNFSKKIFVSFYGLFLIFRIFPIPILYLYLYINSMEINNLDLTYYYMTYVGTLTLVLLNSIWLIFLTLKLFKM